SRDRLGITLVRWDVLFRILGTLPAAKPTIVIFGGYGQAEYSISFPLVKSLRQRCGMRFITCSELFKVAWPVLIGMSLFYPYINFAQAAMKRVAKSVLIIVVTALGLATNATAADDGAALYKARCSRCHGAGGEGKTSMKGTRLKGNTLSAEQLQQLLAQGSTGKKPPHNKPIAGLTADQAKALAHYGTSLQ